IKKIEEIDMLYISTLKKYYSLKSNPRINFYLVIHEFYWSFILGAFSIISAYYNLDTKYSLLIAIGFCGSLTTMSSLALESTIMFENREILNVFLNVLANVSFSILSLVGGRILLTMFLL
ncbi:MAG: CrcB family protein, partial [Nitrosopumilus sp.]|nr:CrcB family protein [Nitrosopumilus sp.]